MNRKEVEKGIECWCETEKVSCALQCAISTYRHCSQHYDPYATGLIRAIQDPD